MATRVPPIPQPPHDPTWLTLDGVQGWQEARLDHVVLTRAGAERSPGAGVLRLAVASGGRALTEASGSFGGLVPPANVAVDVDGGVYLLDVAGATLRRFDRACCAFVVVPCFGGIGPGARQLQDPRGIAFAARQPLRGRHRQPARGRARHARLSSCVRSGRRRPRRRRPVDARRRRRRFAWPTVRRRPRERRVHRFGRGGDWQARRSGLGAVRHLAVDCHDRLYVTIDGQPAVRVFAADDTELSPEIDVEALEGRFAPLPFRVDRDGALDFGPPCARLRRRRARRCRAARRSTSRSTRRRAPT